MVEHASFSYHVVYSERQRSIIRALAARAVRRGLHKAYLEAIRDMEHHLRTDPLDWGDPQNRLANLQLLIYHRVQGPLHVHYAVDEQRRIVYLQKIKPMPNQGLDDVP